MENMLQEIGSKSNLTESHEQRRERFKLALTNARTKQHSNQDAYANLSTIKANQLQIPKVKLNDCNLVLSNFDSSNLKGANLDKSLMFDVSAKMTNFNESSFQNTQLNGAKLYGSTFHEADMQTTNLCGADLTMAMIMNAYFNNSNLSGTRLYGVLLPHEDRLIGANFEYAIMTNYEYHSENTVLYNSKILNNLGYQLTDTGLIVKIK
jgi:uncharacterized protein YjbI with pentapeptide repeats